MTSAISSAQFTIWEDNFNDGNASDWNLIDVDGNSSNWLIRKNIQISNSGQVVDGTVDVLGTYNINMSTGAPLGVVENNWAITPPIDLSYYTGAIEFILHAQRAIYDTPSGDLYIYASTSPERESFTVIDTLHITRQTQLGAEFQDYTTHLTQFAGQSQVYIALVANINSFVGFEVDDVHITAESILGIGAVDGKSSVSLIKQNPVSENLQLKLASQFHTEDTSLQIYNTNGMLVKETAYNETGIFVNNLSSGIYFLIVSDGTTTERLKFIKK